MIIINSQDLHNVFVIVNFVVKYLPMPTHSLALIAGLWSSNTGSNTYHVTLGKSHHLPASIPSSLKCRLKVYSSYRLHEGIYIKHSGQCWYVESTQFIIMMMMKKKKKKEESKQNYSFLKTYHKVLSLTIYILKEGMLWLGVVL